MYISDDELPIKAVENHQLPKAGFNNLLRLHIHAVIKETGQIYQREQYISIEEDVLTNMVRKIIIISLFRFFFSFLIMMLLKLETLQNLILKLSIHHQNNGKVHVL